MPVPITCEEIRQTLREHQPKLAAHFGVRSLALFGSMARNEATAQSDVDLLVEFERPVGLFELFALQDELEALLGRPVDLGTVQSLKPRVRERVLEEAVNVL
jgi:predicted nucleotidyltransferase